MALIATIQTKVDKIRRVQVLRRPAGVGAWMLALILGGLAAEWLLRKYWSAPLNEHGPQ